MLRDRCGEFMEVFNAYRWTMDIRAILYVPKTNVNKRTFVSFTEYYSKYSVHILCVLCVHWSSNDYCDLVDKTEKN